MKKLIIILVVTLGLPLVAIADRISGVCHSGIYGWSYNYGIEYVEDSIIVEVGLHAIGVDNAPLLTTFENGIEAYWSTDRFEVPIIIDVNWVDSDWNQQVNIIGGYGRSNMYNWYEDCVWMREYTAAHEFGHMLGLYDEYINGALDPETGYVTSGLMGRGNSYTTYDYYYDDILGWYHDFEIPPIITVLDMVEPNHTQVPEPTTLILLGLGLIATSGYLRKGVKM